MAKRRICAILLILGASDAFLMNSPTPSTVPINSASTMSINSESTMQQIIKLFNDERHKLELYVASKEQALNARELALELKVNKTIEELTKATSELNKEKAKIIKVEREVDQLTMQIFNLTTNNNQLQAKVRGLESRNIDLEHQLQGVERNATLFGQRIENVEQNITWQICTTDCKVFTQTQTQTLSRRKYTDLVQHS